MKGILVINGFWKGASMVEMEALLSGAAKKQGIALSVIENRNLLFSLPSMKPLSVCPEVDFVLFWDKDIRLAMMLENAGYRVLNPAKSIALCDDKTLTHLALSKARLPMPQTILCPATFPAVSYTCFDFLREAAAQLTYPLVIKEGCGSFGQQVYLAQNEEMATAILQSRAGQPLLLQQFIRESSGRDVRLYMVGGQCIAAMERRNDSDFRANIQNGGSPIPYTPTQQEVQLAEQGCAALGLDFAGVDILHSVNGPLICEINSNAHFSALAALTHQDIAGAIFSHIREVVCKAG